MIQSNISTFERQNWVARFNQTTTAPTQNFQDELLQSRQDNKANLQSLYERLNTMKDNVRAKFDTGLINTWKFFEYYAENPLPTTIDSTAIDKVKSDMAQMGLLPDTFAYANDYKDGVSYLTDSIQNRKLGIMSGSLAATDLDTMEWDAIGAKSIVESELKARGFNDVSESQYQESLKTLSKLLNQVLDKEFAKDSKSSLTNALLVLRAELELTPEKWDKIQTKTKESLQQPLNELLNPNANLEEIEKQLTQIHNALSDAAGVDVLVPLDKMAALLYEHLSPNEQQEMFDALSQVNSYIHKNTSTMISTNDSETQLKMQSAAFYNDLVSRFSAIDNTETLLNLFGDSSLHDSKESKSYESLIDTIRAKLKTTDDSLLQKLMSNITNAPKSAEVSA